MFIILAYFINNPIKLVRLNLFKNKVQILKQTFRVSSAVYQKAAKFLKNIDNNRVVYYNILIKTFNVKDEVHYV